MPQIAFTLNGVARHAEVVPGESLLEVLRNRCGIISTKDGCSPQGQCGCCLALVNGHPKTTCAVPAEKADGTDILTLEGVSAEDRDLCARAFTVAAGVQCGFCIPGFALRAKWLLDRHPNPRMYHSYESDQGCWWRSAAGYSSPGAGAWRGRRVNVQDNLGLLPRL